MGYIRIPLETNPELLAVQVFNTLKIHFPTWTENPAELDTWIIRAIASLAAQNRDLVTDVQDDIYRSFGSTLVGIQPTDAASATGTTTWTLQDSLGHTIPAGTIVGLRDSLGNLVAFQTVADVVVPNGSSATAAGAVVISAVIPGAAGTGLGGVGAPVELVDVYSWVQSITITALTSGGVDAESDSDYLSRLARRMQSLSQRPILPNDFALMALDADPGVKRALALDGYNSEYNALTANEASMETDAAGWSNYANATIASTAAQAADGTKSVSLTALSAADMGAQLVAANYKVAAPGERWTAVASLRAATTVRNVQVGLQWLTGAGAVISTVFAGSAAGETNSGWTQFTHTAIAPATTARVLIVVKIVAPANTEVHYLDKAALRKGSETAWSAGGTAETNNERMVTVIAVDASGIGVTGSVKTNVDALLEANREVNFVINQLDPNYTVVTPAVTVKVATGYSNAVVDANITTALTNYFSPARWAIDPTVTDQTALQTWVEQTTVYYNEVITLISNVEGVDRVTALTLNGVAGNLTLIGPAALTTLGVVTITHA